MWHGMGMSQEPVGAASQEDMRFTETCHTSAVSYTGGMDTVHVRAV
jgi:hypothetical protein